MAKKSFKKAGKPMVADEPPPLPVTTSPVETQVQDSPSAELSETEAGPPPAEPSAVAAPAPEPPHLLTPLAEIWPTAAPPTAARPQAPAAAAAKAPPIIAPRTVKVRFMLLDLGAKQVALCGDFNGWVAHKTPLKRGADGNWETTLALAPGRYEYKFVVDGQWIPDPQARAQVWNAHGTLNSVVEVKG